MSQEKRIILVLITNMIAVFLVGEINGLLAHAGLYLCLDAMLLLFPALYMRVLPGMIAVGLTAMLLFALKPFNYTWGVGGMMLMLLVMTRFRGRFRRENPKHVALMAVFANTLVFLAYTVGMGAAAMEGGTWLRVGADFLLSQAVIWVLAPVWVRLHRKILLLMGVDLGAELQRL